MNDPRILTTYVDALGAERTSPQWVVDHVLSVLEEDRGAAGFVDVVRTAGGVDALRGRTLRLEDGGEVAIDGDLPADLPYGYHQVDGDDGPILVLHAPTTVPAPAHRRGWVLAAQLYSARSSESWGHGDLRDARRMGEWAREAGPGAYVMLNPLHAPIPGPSPQPSPYFASSRIYRNPLYICVDEVPGADAVPLSGWRDEARRLNETRLLDRRLAWGAKRAALAALWEHQRDQPEVRSRVEAWLADQANHDYARFCVAAEQAGGQPPERTVAHLRRQPTSDLHRFHAWLQILVEDQLLAAGDNLVHDVAVGTDRAGADTWVWPDAFVLDGTRIGAPPDQFNTLGQDWGLPPVHPAGLRAAGYEPFIRGVRSAVRGAAGIRIDHIMGLERLYWIPGDAAPSEGVYVRYELAELLDVVAIEAHRAGAFVVGEDLGTVPPSVPAAMAERGILSYRVMALDPNHPSTYPEMCMAAVTTHDLPTSVGLLTGQDLQDQRELDLSPNVEDTEASVARLHEWTGREPGEDGIEDTVVAFHELLASSPAELVAATLEDLALMKERPNMPGTIDAWPNWTWGLPVPLEDVLASGLAKAVRTAMAARTEEL